MLTYAEIHYRPFGIPGLIYENQPEIIFDAPFRVNPDQPVSVFIIIKDADKFPIVLKGILFHIKYENGMEKTAAFPYGKINIDSDIWYDTINIMPEFKGKIIIKPFLFFTQGKKELIVNTHNYKGLPIAPLNVFAAFDPLPCANGWYSGDIHCHSFYTSDQVEFGPPVAVFPQVSKCLGLDWVCVTDHSYDLDDAIDDYLADDPDIPKWKLLDKEVEDYNESFCLIRGEEATCRNESGQNCHLLAINSDVFIKGSGDGGQKGMNNKTELSLQEAVAECDNNGGIACAAHPFEKIPFLEKLFLKRDEWSTADIINSGVKYIQIYNGIRDTGFEKGKKQWINFLLNGHRIYAFGGNDSHGGFNKNIRIGIPFISVTNSEHRLFGNVRTAVFAESSKKDDIMKALKNGRAIVTDGPFIDFRINKDVLPGDILNAGKKNVTVSSVFMSNIEFGFINKIYIYAGLKYKNIEEPVEIKIFTPPVSDYEFNKEIICENYGYIRAECETVKGKICFTNPVFFENS